MGAILIDIKPSVLVDISIGQFATPKAMKPNQSWSMNRSAT